MTSGQAVIVACSFTYLLIACGSYAYIMSKLQPYAAYLPAAISLAFVRLIVGVATFGWPLVLAIGAYVKFIEVMGKLAGVKWDEVLPKAALVGINSDGTTAFDPDLPLSEKVGPMIQGLHIEMIVKRPDEDKFLRMSTYMTRNALDRLAHSKTPLGLYLCKHALKPHDTTDIAPEVGEEKIDAEFESDDEPQPTTEDKANG